MMAGVVLLEAGDVSRRVLLSANLDRVLQSSEQLPFVIMAFTAVDKALAEMFASQKSVRGGCLLFLT